MTADEAFIAKGARSLRITEGTDAPVVCAEVVRSGWRVHVWHIEMTPSRPIITAASRTEVRISNGVLWKPGQETIVHLDLDEGWWMLAEAEPFLVRIAYYLTDDWRLPVPE